MDMITTMIVVPSEGNEWQKSATPSSLNAEEQKSSSNFVSKSSGIGDAQQRKPFPSFFNSKKGDGGSSVPSGGDSYQPKPAGAWASNLTA